MLLGGRRARRAIVGFVLIPVIVIVAVVVLLALGFYLTRGGGVPGGVEDPAMQAVILGQQTPADHGPTRDFIGEEEHDLDKDPQVEAELWESERERYRQRDEPS